MSTPTNHLRSIYRSILRELPHGPKQQPQSSSPIRASIRSHFANANTQSQSQSQSYTLARRQEAEQFIQYLKAQRMYGTLIERYNPGMNMEEEERVRLTARRVGMDMPDEWYGKVKK